MIERCFKNPVFSDKKYSGPIAQWIERGATDSEVEGSSPSGSASNTNKKGSIMNFIKWITHASLQKAVLCFFVLIIVFILILALTF